MEIQWKVTYYNDLQLKLKMHALLMCPLLSLFLSLSPIYSIYTDHNEDNTSVILQEWATNALSTYHSIKHEQQTEWTYSSKDLFEWDYDRLQHMCTLRQRAMDDARSLGADYILVSECMCLCVCTIC